MVRTSQQIEEQARARLQSEAKTTIWNVLVTLESLQTTLRSYGAMVEAGRDGTAVLEGSSTVFESPPEAVALMAADGTLTPVLGTLSIDPLSPEQQTQLTSLSGALIVRASLSGGRTGHALLVPSETGAIAASLSLSTLLAANVDTLPPETSLCLLADGEVVCSDAAPVGLGRVSLQSPPDSDLQFDLDSGRYFVRTRMLPVHLVYGNDPWMIALARPESFIRAPLEGFVRDFWLVLVFSALAMAWLSFGQVRRQLRPLGLLTAAARRFAKRDFDTPVGINSQDEFEELGRTFGDMTTELRRQFDDLEAFSAGTLVALSRAIDANSSWTAGHSERVTDLAVAIAQEMRIPDDEVQILARGGLVHDIGKVATPRSILDKPGPLTEAEYDVLKKHPMDGVHILKPIPAFARLLPVVGEHHERWDGQGYPLGLAGTAITRVGRVLAVADSIDAMQSDRPYRRGMLLEIVLRELREGAGHQFDAEVVDAAVVILTRAQPPVALERSA